MMMRFTAAMVCAALLTGCATRGANYVPLVDMKDKQPDKFAVDLAECQEYAKTRVGAGQAAMVGAVIGAVLGVALAVAGRHQRDYAAVGALAGAAGAADGANNTQEGITKQCLAGRGYNVLN